jgi:hypothetical protein
MAAQSSPSRKKAEANGSGDRRLDAAALSQLVRARMRELGISQPQLAMMVAQSLGEPVVGQGAVSRWLDDITAIGPPRVFAIEAALQYKPGTLSDHCGFGPPLSLRGPERLGVIGELERDLHLTPDQIEVMVSLYKLQVAQNQRKHSQSA